MDQAENKGLKPDTPSWPESYAARKHQHRKHEENKEPPTYLDFSPSPYVKNGILQDLRPKDFIGACKKPEKADEPEEHLRPPKPVEIAQHFKSFDLLKSKTPFDPNRPTVVVLDEFKKATYSPNGSNKPGLSHGEISAAAAEQAGFNVLRLHLYDQAAIPTALAEINKEGQAGALPLKPGDAINISYAHYWTWKEANCALHMSVTPESYASERPEIINRVQAAARGDRPVRAAADGIELTMAAATIKEIDELQRRGITVVNAAGNEGQGHLNLDFINAKVQLAAGDFKGRAFPYSGLNSLTKTYPSSFEMMYDPSKKAYWLRNTQTYFPEQDFGGAPNHRHCERVDSNGEPQPKQLRSMADRPSCAVAIVAGTSFSNVTFWPMLKKEQEEKGGKQ
jgi:hypothetical protein